MSRNAVLYVATLAVLLGLDIPFLAIVAKGFFQSQVGEMLGEIRPVPAVLFYLVYVAGVLIFVSGQSEATWRSALLYGALFGLFCYATFELTSLTMLRQWTWAVVLVDISWGVALTAVSAAAGLMIADWVMPRT
jgi:uncharacterized membrane protein